MIRPIFLVALTGTIGLAVLTKPTVVKSDFDLAGLNQQVQNHEARITNNEKDITALQDNTNTQPAPDKVAVPEVTAQPVAPAPAPAVTTPSITVASISTDRKEGDITWCDVTYSDGTTVSQKYQEFFPLTGVTYTHDTLCGHVKVGDLK